MSIKLRLTLWNTLFMVILVVIVLTSLLFIGDHLILSTAKSRLIEVVEENWYEIELNKNGSLDLEDVEFFEDQVSTLIYNMEGVVIAGTISNLDQFNMALIHDNMVEVTIDGKNFIIYDLLYEYRGEPVVFIRGIISTDSVSNTLHTVFFMAYIFLPLYILISAMGSYFISLKSLSPLNHMIETAKEISNSDDLSLRIGLEEKKNNEIHNLATTFDAMFLRLEESFLQEKQFSSDVSHELRTPTAVILAECQCMLEGEPTLEEQRDALQVIQRQGIKMETIIRNLLALIRLENGTQSIIFDKIDLSELVEIVCEEQESLLSDSETLRQNITNGIFVSGDYSMVIRILSNLIDNGFSYGKEGGYVEVSLEKTEKSAILTIKDDGIGIPDDSLDKIFHRFYQVDSARSSQEKGSMGLGLSMVAQLVKLHHGKISVESHLGEGSTFTISLPLFSEEQADEK